MYDNNDNKQNRFFTIHSFNASRWLVFTCAFALLTASGHARNAGFKFISGGTLATGRDPGAILALPGTNDLLISSYRDSSVMAAGRSAAGFVAPPTGTYYDGRNFDGKRVARKDATIDFDWGNDAPLPGFGADSFSIRWTGELRVEHSGTYRFTTECDDGVRLWLDDQQIIDQWHDTAPAFYSGEIELQGGRTYKLRMDYYENGGGALARLYWEPPGTGDRRVILPVAGGFIKHATADAGLGARALASGDVNGDGRADLAVANYNFNATVTVLLSAADAPPLTGGARQSVESVGDDPIALALVDLNGDALPELIVLNRSSGDLRIFPRATPSTNDAKLKQFYNSTDAVRIALPANADAPVDLAVADFTGDKLPDLCVLAGDVYVFPNVSGEIQASPRRFPITRENEKNITATSMAAADLDRDGDMDLALALTDARKNITGVAILRNQGNPEFALQPADDALVRNVELAESADVTTYGVVRASDLDGDGLADVVLNHPTQPKLFVYRNEARKGLATTKALRAVPFQISDLNGDGNADIAALHGFAATVSVWFAR